MNSIFLNYQYKLYYHNPSYFIIDLGVGLSFHSSKLKSGLDYSDIPFGDLPDVSVNFSPGLIYMLRVHKEFALQIGRHYILLLNDNDKIFPSYSGFLLALGLCLELKKR